MTNMHGDSKSENDQSFRYSGYCVRSILTEVIAFLQNEHNHCVTYYAYPTNKQLKFICCIADDKAEDIIILSHEQP